jgi:8-oxo-dGTP diphosphatase
MPLGWPESRSGWLGHVLDDLLLLVGRYGVASTEIGAWLFNIPRRLTAFACAVDPEGRVLMVQHERLGVVRWELPGGHVDPGEPVAAAAERETAEETGLAVVATQVIAEAVHRWHGNEVGIVYFRAEPVHSEHAVSRVPEPAIRAVGWLDPAVLTENSTSPLAYPVIKHFVSGSGSRPLYFDATHHKTPDGWEPVVLGRWQNRVPCWGVVDRAAL